MMPTAEDRQRDAMAARDRRFRPPTPETPPQRPPMTLAEAERMAEVRWAHDRAARIRKGACPICAERRCPRVGGPDVECVPGAR